MWAEVCVWPSEDVRDRENIAIVDKVYGNSGRNTLWNEY